MGIACKRLHSPHPPCCHLLSDIGNVNRFRRCNPKETMFQCRSPKRRSVADLRETVPVWFSWLDLFYVLRKLDVSGTLGTVLKIYSGNTCLNSVRNFLPRWWFSVSQSGWETFSFCFLFLFAIGLTNRRILCCSTWLDRKCVYPAAYIGLAVVVGLNV